MLDLYKAINSLRKINEGPNKMGPQEITVGDRVEFEGEKFEVVDVELDTIVADNLETGLRNRLKTDEVTLIFGMDGTTDQEKQDMEDMFKRLDKVPSGSLKSVATEDDMENIEERVTYNTLAKLSGIKDPNKINIGQKVKLPNGSSYTVKKGDTLSGIAEKYRLLMKDRKQDTAPSQKNSPGNPFSPDKKITPSQKGSPGNPFSPDKKIKDKPSGQMPLAPPSKNIDKKDPRIQMPNQYALNKDGDYKPKIQADIKKKDNDSILGYKFGDMQKAFNKFVGNIKKDPSYDKIGKDQAKKYGGLDQKINPKSSNKTANKNMIKRITGANT